MIVKPHLIHEEFHYVFGSCHIKLKYHLASGKGTISCRERKVKETFDHPPTEILGHRFAFGLAADFAATHLREVA